MTHLSRRSVVSGVLALAMALAVLFVVRGDSGAQVAPPRLDHFKCYVAQGQPANAVVQLQDQFDSPAGLVEQADVMDPVRFCNPTAKKFRGKVTPIENPDAHLKMYRIRVPTDPTVPPTAWQVVYNNQFGSGQKLLALRPVVLAVPTQKVPQPWPQGLDHFKCYAARGEAPKAVVKLRDQFHAERGIKVFEPLLFCNPTVKFHAGTVSPIENPDAHLVCYRIRTRSFTGTVIAINQFGTEDLTVTDADMLCVPSVKVAFSPVPLPPDVPVD